jgi:hypothetical protein
MGWDGIVCLACFRELWKFCVHMAWQVFGGEIIGTWKGYESVGVMVEVLEVSSISHYQLYDFGFSLLVKLFVGTRAEMMAGVPFVNGSAQEVSA